MGIPIIRPSRGRRRPACRRHRPRRAACRRSPRCAVDPAGSEFPAPVAARHRHPRSRRRRRRPPAAHPDRARSRSSRPRPPRAARSPCGSGWSAATASRSPAAVVALLDDHGREVDTAKTAADGGGELHSPARRPVPDDRQRGRLPAPRGDPHRRRRGRSSSRCCCPARPRSAGRCAAGASAVRDARVAVRQDRDVVDEALTAGDGRYRFDDLAEGTYTVAASAASGSRRGAVEPRRGRGPATSTWTSWGRTAHADRVEHVDGRLAGVGGVELYWQGWLPAAPRAGCC